MPFIRSILILVLTLGALGATSAMADQPRWQNPDDDSPYYRDNDDDDRYAPQRYDFRNMPDLYQRRGNRVIRECRPFLSAHLDIGDIRFRNPVEGQPDKVQSARVKLRLIHAIKRKKYFYCQYGLAGGRYEPVLEYRMRCRGAKYHDRRGRFSCKWG